MDANKRQKLLTTGAVIGLAEPLLMGAMHAGGIGAIVGLGAGALAYGFYDDLAALASSATKGKDQDGPSLSADGETPKRQVNKTSLAYRLLNGKSTRGELAPAGQEEDSLQAEPETETLERPSVSEPLTANRVPGQFRLEKVLDEIAAANAEGNIYFGQTATGPVSLPIKEVYHILDVSKSGKGKSNRFRLWMTQLVRMAKVVYINPFAAPVKPVSDFRQIEVWQPLYDKLVLKRPMKSGTEILSMLDAVLKEIDRRVAAEERRDFGFMKHPMFVFIDELPEVYARCGKEAPTMIDRLVRTGRQYCVFAIVASQSALVKDIGLSTASQAQFKTLVYGGGAYTSWNRLIGSGFTSEQETLLMEAKAGLTFLGSEGFDLRLLRYPLVTNEAMFAHLGLPSFRLQDWNAPLTDELPAYTSGSPENAFIGPVNTPVNGSTSTLETPESTPRLRLLETPINVNTEQVGPSKETINVNAETRKMIRRMVDEGIPHRKIAKIVGIYGPKYDIYKQVCQEEGIKIEKEA